MNLKLRKAALACGVAGIALAWESPAWAQQRMFDVPSGDAVKAIPEFARQAGIQIVAPADQIRGVQTPPIKGFLDINTALSILLAGTDVVVAWADGETIALVNKKDRQESQAASQVRLAADVPAVRMATDAGLAAQQVAAAPPPPAQVAAPQNAAPPVTPVEDVLITGSLIHGTEAVGIPVTSLGTMDFKQTGALSVADLLRAQPAVFASPSTSSTATAGNFQRHIRVDIHNFGTGHTLGLINGMRFPLQADTGTIFDPSFIPQLSIDRIDVLAGGASATYGSDAEAGVINIILKRGYNGAVTEASIGASDGGGFNWRFAQLYGTSWDSGDVTVTFETGAARAIQGTARDYLTVDFTPWGLANLTPIRSASPGIVSTGAPNATTGTGCTNCFSVPKGQGVSGLTWNDLLANKGVNNLVNPYSIAHMTPPQQNNAATITFDYDIMEGVEFFVDAFYANRRGQQIIPATINPGSTGTILTLTVPATNPYYPAGAPAGLRVSYTFGIELPPRSSYHEISRRYAGGFNLELPYEWNGKVYGSANDESNVTIVSNLVNSNNALAALGNTVASIPAAGARPGIAAFIKPANVPFLNLFCDPNAFQCNDPLTLGYITSDNQRTRAAHYLIHEYGANFDGPLFDLPGGTVRAAVGGNYVSANYQVNYSDAFSAPTIAFSSPTIESNARQTYAFFGQVNVPVFGNDFTMPLVEKLNLEFSVRHDHYSDFGTTTNPKIAANWTITDGFTLRGAVGSSFVAPSFAQLSAVASRTVQPLNTIVGGPANNFASCPTVGGSPVAGTAGADINPTCSSALQFAGGISVKGGVGGLSGLLRPDGYALGPETSTDTSFGFEYVPTNRYLSGLNLSANYWRSDMSNVVVAIADAEARLTDPNTAFVFRTRANTPDFDQVVAQLLSHPAALGFTQGAASNISFILDGAARNAGKVIHDGIDFSGSYNWEMENLGVWETGIVGTYYLTYSTSGGPGLPATDLENVNGALVVRDGVVTTVDGQTQDVRMRYRARLGWTADNWTVTGFMNYRAHFFTNEVLPAPAILAASGITNYSNLVPSHYTFDLAVSYDFADTLQNEYLRNIAVQLVVNDITNKAPPFAYKASTSGSGASAFWGLVDSPIQRSFVLTLTKTWYGEMQLLFKPEIDPRHGTGSVVRRGTRIFAGTLIPFLLGVSQVEAQPTNPVPDFSGFWQHGIGGLEYIPPADGGPGPVMDVLRSPACPPAGDRDPRPQTRSPLCGARTAGIPFVGDVSNPVLKPAAVEAIKAANAKWIAGEEMTTASSRCMASGVPRILGVQAPLQILQTTNEIVFAHQRDDQVRHVYLDQGHTVNPKPSWYGESVGHYEGDTLVVDTIAQNDQSVLDYFSTPHSVEMRVVERFRLINNGRTLQVHFMIEDPKFFNSPWTATLEYQRSPTNVTVLKEERCAENNRGVDHPVDETPDF